jgi:hypothetical protein
VHVNHVLRRIAAVATLSTPLSKLHQPGGKSHNGPFANGGAFTRRVDAAKKTAACWQMTCASTFRARCSFVELLLKPLEADEDYKCRSPRSAEVILGQILERMG